jgi:hypothetical protein
VSYYQTVAEPTQAVLDFTSYNDKQDSRVLEFFRAHPGQGFTPYEVQAALYPGDALKIIGVKRAMSDLTKDGYLIKTSQLRNGATGRSNHVWRLKSTHAHTV